MGVGLSTNLLLSKLIQAPNAPFGVRVSPVSGQTQAYNIAWNDNSECGSPRYVVSLYNTQGQMVKEHETARRDMIINLDDSCENLDVGIKGVNEAGASEESSRIALVRRT
ncbi:hypothetical protein T265_16152, partial [Opisthorchis viverrini]